MEFRGNIRTLIKESHLQYLSHDRRKVILSNLTNGTVESINGRVKNVFEGIDLEDYTYYTYYDYFDVLLISNLCGCFGDLESILQIPDVDMICSNLFKVTLKNIIKISNSREDFIKICQIIFKCYGKPDSVKWGIHYICNICISPDECIIGLENEDVQYLVRYASPGKLNYLFEELKISCIGDLYLLFDGPIWEHLKKILRNGSLDHIKNILRKEKVDVSGILINNNIVFSRKAKVGYCNGCEKTNRLILEGNKINAFYEIYSEGQVIGYIKQLGERSLLAIKDVYSKQGILMLTRGMVYAVEDVESIHNPIFLDLGDILSINPMRMIELKDIDILISQFLVNFNFQ